jgi:MarR family transcriptional regulator for hemolysin
MPAPKSLPMGLHINQAARVIAQAFDAALIEAGGSLPMWLVLLNLKTGRSAKQRELAEAIGIREATLTHHLNSMESDGLLTRSRSEANRRVHVVALTAAGEGLFVRLRQAASEFDRSLTRGVTVEARHQLAQGLDQLVANVGRRMTPVWTDQPKPDADDSVSARSEGKR